MFDEISPGSGKIRHNRPNDNRTTMAKFGIGQAVRRVEDQRFIRGQGRYVDDIGLPGECHGVTLSFARLCRILPHPGDISSNIPENAIRPASSHALSFDCSKRGER
jgi:hypothetical protein